MTPGALFLFFTPLQIVVVGPNGVRYRPFKGFATIMGADCRILWYGFLTSEENMEETCPHITAVAKRIHDAGVQLKVVYCDKCCHYRKKIVAVRPTTRSYS